MTTNELLHKILDDIAQITSDRRLKSFINTLIESLKQIPYLTPELQSLLQQTILALKRLKSSSQLALISTVGEKSSGFKLLLEPLAHLLLSEKPGRVEIRGDYAWGGIFIIGGKIVGAIASTLEKDFYAEEAICVFLKQNQCHLSFYMDLDVVRAKYTRRNISHTGTGIDFLLNQSTTVENYFKKHPDEKINFKKSPYPPNFIRLLLEFLEEILPYLRNKKIISSDKNNSFNDKAVSVLLSIAEQIKEEQNLENLVSDEKLYQIRNILIRRILRWIKADIIDNKADIYGILQCIEEKQDNIMQELQGTFGDDIFGIGDICRSFSGNGIIRLLMQEDEESQKLGVGTIYIDRNRIYGALIEELGNKVDSQLIATGKNAARRIIANAKNIAIFQVINLRKEIENFLPDYAKIDKTEQVMWTVLDAEQVLYNYQSFFPRRTIIESISLASPDYTITNSLVEEIKKKLVSPYSFEEISSFLFQNKAKIEEKFLTDEERNELTDIKIYETIFDLLAQEKICLRRNYKDLSDDMSYIEFECQRLSKQLEKYKGKPLPLLITFYGEEELPLGAMILAGEEVKTVKSRTMLMQEQLQSIAKKDTTNHLEELFQRGVEEIKKTSVDDWLVANRAKQLEVDFYTALSRLILDFHIAGYIKIELAPDILKEVRINSALKEFLIIPQVLLVTLYQSKENKKYHIRTSKFFETIRLQEQVENPEKLIQKIENQNITNKFERKLIKALGKAEEKTMVAIQKISDYYLILLLNKERGGFKVDNKLFKKADELSELLKQF